MNEWMNEWMAEWKSLLALEITLKCQILVTLIK